jgi:hypothetical protein
MAFRGGHGAAVEIRVMSSIDPDPGGGVEDSRTHSDQTCHSVAETVRLTGDESD